MNTGAHHDSASAKIFFCEACNQSIPLPQIITRGKRIDGKILCAQCAQKAARSGHLRHGDWLASARASLKTQRFSTPMFALLMVFALLYLGSMALFERLDTHGSGVLYAAKVAMSSLFAVSLGFILSEWWNKAVSIDKRIAEAERVDHEYRELLLSFSDNLFHIINALNTLASNPPRSFMVATDFLLGEYVGLLQTRLQRHGDGIAGLGFDADEFLDEKIRIFEGIRDRAGMSIKGMPKEVQTLFAGKLHLVPGGPGSEAPLERQELLRLRLGDLVQTCDTADQAAGTPESSEPGEAVEPVPGEAGPVGGGGRRDGGRPDQG